MVFRFGRLLGGHSLCSVDRVGSCIDAPRNICVGVVRSVILNVDLGLRIIAILRNISVVSYLDCQGAI